MADKTTDLQQLWVEMLCSNEQVFNTCNTIIQPVYFNPNLRPVVDFVQGYYDEYHSLPSMEVINAETSSNLKTVSLTQPHEIEYCTDQIEKFCKQRAVYVEVLNASDTIKVGGYALLLEKIEKAVTISLNRDLGINIFENVEERMEQRKESRKTVSTGWENIDIHLGGGLAVTEMMMISANSGGGKSISLSNYGIHMASLGYDVLYASLELSEELVADRFETMITSQNKADRFADISGTARKMRDFQTRTGGNIYIKHFEADVTNANHIKAYLKEFHNKHGKYPDVLIVDYLDIMAPNSNHQYSNVFEKDKAIATQVRNLGNNKKHPMWMATASQENRGAINETDKSQGNIAGGLSKVNTVDVYISITMNDAMRSQGYAIWKFLKTRSSDGVGKSVNMRWDPISLTFTADSSERPVRDVESVSPVPFKPAQTSLSDLMED